MLINRKLKNKNFKKKSCQKRSPDEIKRASQSLVNDSQSYRSNGQLSRHSINADQLLCHVDQSYHDMWLYQSLQSGVIRCCHVIPQFVLCHCPVNHHVISHIIDDQLPCNLVGQHRCRHVIASAAVTFDYQKMHEIFEKTL